MALDMDVGMKPKLKLASQKSFFLENSINTFWFNSPFLLFPEVTDLFQVVVLVRRGD